jgi:quercetin dioxygenase-like cupin family protein
MRITLALASLAVAALPAAAQQTPSPNNGRPYYYAFVPKPAPVPYTGVNRPIWRLDQVLAANKGKASWRQQVIATPRFSGEWIQMARGERTRPQFYGDDRVMWVVWGGQIRFHIDGQQPFVASKGFLVQVPFRTAYWMETVGDEPALRFEVTHAGIKPSFPAGETDKAAPPGYIKVTAPNTYASDTYGKDNKLSIDFFKDIVAANIVPPVDDRYLANDGDTMSAILRGPGTPTPPPSNRGHFHNGYDEFWVILEGTCEYLIEGQKELITARPGDVVLATPNRWHRAAWAGTGMATRLAFNARTGMFHTFGEDAEGRQR